MNVNKVPIFVSSCDSYVDIWPAFFALLKREWPEYSGTIYLNTESLDYAHEGLNIVCTKLGKQRRFGETFLRGMECVKEDRFLLLMIDYFIEGRVDVAKLQEIYDIFINDDIDTFTLTTQPFGYHSIHSHPGYSYLMPNEAWRIMFSFQAAFWKKASLRRIIYQHEDPWRSEYLGSRRAALENMKFYLLSCRNDKPIRYDESGVLHGGGKWLMPAISRIDLEGIPLDLNASKRQVFSESASSVWGFIGTEIKLSPMKIRSWMKMVARHPKAVVMIVSDIWRRLSKIVEATGILRQRNCNGQ